jgi:hypothetical protein
MSELAIAVSSARPSFAANFDKLPSNDVPIALPVESRALEVTP